MDANIALWIDVILDTIKWHVKFLYFLIFVAVINFGFYFVGKNLWEAEGSFDLRFSLTFNLL